MDEFLAKHLFHPPIIRWCQWRGCDQHTFANYLWTLACMLNLTDNPSGFLGWFFYGFWILATFFCVQRIALRPSTPVSPNRFMRIMAVVFSGVKVLGIIAGVALGRAVAIDLIDFFFLVVAFAEYARTIAKIPPRVTKERTNGVYVRS